jgi:hypothetical protein
MYRLWGNCSSGTIYSEIFRISVAIPFGNLVTFPVLIDILIKEYKKVHWKNILVLEISYFLVLICLLEHLLYSFSYIEKCR